MNMTSLLKSSLNGLSGSSSEAVAEGAGRATGEMASGEGARRDPEVVAIARRRQFSGSEKRRLIAEAERCKDAGTLGAFLRREHIYSSMISGWRKHSAHSCAASRSAWQIRRRSLQKDGGQSRMPRHCHQRREFDLKPAVRICLRWRAPAAPIRSACHRARAYQGQALKGGREDAA